jgi:hypothetical protein
MPVRMILSYTAIGLLILFSVITGAMAVDTGITIQTSASSSYGATYPLSRAIVGQLKAHEDSDDPATIGNALRRLNDGDVLVLAVHSNPGVFGLGAQGVPWAAFWRTFGIDRPPRLASIVIGGCMACETKTGGATGYQYVTEAQLEAIRVVFNAKTIFAPRAEINPLVIMADIEGLLRAFYGGKKLIDINLQNRWHYMADKGVDKGTVTLTHLRIGGKELQDCLCQCMAPVGGKFTCTYDTKNPGTSPSCRDISNGPCFCRAEAPSPGCYRRQPPASGQCYDECVRKYGGR